MNIDTHTAAANRANSDCKQVLDRAAADHFYNLALKSINSGELTQAESNLAKALEQHPGLMILYRAMGELFEKQGEIANAESCYTGVLPDSINLRYFTTDSSSGTTSLDHPSQAYNTTVCHKSTERELTKPNCVSIGHHSFFDRRTIRSSEAVIDSVPDGTIWFDGFNRVVTDSNNTVINRHSRGNVELIRTVCSHIEPMAVDGRLFFVGNRGFSNFYHWMLDIFPSFALFSQSGYQISEQDKVVVLKGETSFQKSTMEHLGIRKEQIIEISKGTPYLSADEIIVPNFHNAMAMKLGAWVPEFLQTTFLNTDNRKIRPVNRKGGTGERLYLARGDDAKNGRSIDNESELISFLQQYGIRVVYPERYSIQQQAEIFATAEVVVAAHGAGLTNIVFCQPGTKIIEIYGDYMATCYWAISAVCDLDYYNHYCAGDSATLNSKYSGRKNIEVLRHKGFVIVCEELEKLFELAEIELLPQVNPNNLSEIAKQCI